MLGGQLSAHRRSACREDMAEPQTHKTESAVQNTHDLFSPGQWRRLTAQLQGPGSSILPPLRDVSTEAALVHLGDVLGSQRGRVGAPLQAAESGRQQTVHHQEKTNEAKDLFLIQAQTTLALVPHPAGDQVLAQHGAQGSQGGPISLSCARPRDSAPVRL